MELGGPLHGTGLITRNQFGKPSTAHSSVLSTPPRRPVMDLLDRYLREVALWLPRRQSADIVAEISADLQAEAEGQAHALGRPVSRAEEEAILTRWGHPMLVASRYQPQVSLIGPALLPTYRFVLKVLSLRSEEHTSELQ